MLLLSSKRARFQPRTSLLSKRSENNEQRGKGENLDLSLIHKSKPEVMKKENGKQEQKLCSSDEKRGTENMNKNSVQVVKKKGNGKHGNGGKNSVQVMRKG